MIIDLPKETPMKLYTGMGPNPRVVHICLAEKGLDVERVAVDLMSGENRQEEHLARNPAGQLPCLETDDGAFVSEITAICEYVDEKHPTPPLIGSSAEERAETRMWMRRIDLNICEPLANAFRFGAGLELFKSRIHVIPHASDDLAQITQTNLTWLDGLMQGREFVCGDRYTVADILLYAFLEFGGQVGQPLDAKLETLQSWYTRVAARPAVEASK
jgi:glutathione S-transferase